jgi:hypothetical protein
MDWTPNFLERCVQGLVFKTILSKRKKFELSLGRVLIELMMLEGER